jgi:hypothetical protein
VAPAAPLPDAARERMLSGPPQQAQPLWQGTPVPTVHPLQLLPDLPQAPTRASLEEHLQPQPQNDMLDTPRSKQGALPACHKSCRHQGL